MARVPDDHRDKVGLPPRAFLYTIDQIAAMIEVDLVAMKRRYIHFEGKTLGGKRPEKMLARTLEPESGRASDWRVTEREFIRWLQFKGFRLYSRGYIE